jgi:phycocyanobilin:ferredoxin oxidoreductase
MVTSNQPSLRQHQHGLICRLADCIESTWRRYLDLEPYQIPPDLNYIENDLQDERLTIENICYQTPQFRKLHLELAKMGNNLEILHCVMFPRTTYPLPLFGTDIVSGRGTISAAIADLSPVNRDRQLPKPYISALSALPSIPFSQPRDLPAWGDIFSDFCVFVRPTDSLEETLFLERVQQFLSLHCQLATEIQPVTSWQAHQEIMAGHKNYCTKQQQNDKTRRVLEKYFGSEWSDRYMTTMLFDGAV